MNIARSQRRVRLKQWECTITRLQGTLLQGDQCYSPNDDDDIDDEDDKEKENDEYFIKYFLQLL